MDDVVFILNPHSSNGKIQPIKDEILKFNPSAKCYVSESIEQMNIFIDEVFEDTQIFVAIGGDGTISTVAQRLINTDKILAIFPAGSGNGFSRETHFEKNFKQLFDKIKNRKSQKIDSFLVNDHFSINVSGTGFDGKVVKEFEKTNRGFQNYIRVTLQTFFSYKPIKVTFHTSGFEKFDGEYLMLNVANTRQFGNNAYIAPTADFSDGKLDVVLVKKFPVHYSALFAYRMFTKKLKDDDYIQYLSVGELEFSVDTTDWHIDGEFRKIPSPVRVKVQRESLRILV